MKWVTTSWTHSTMLFRDVAAELSGGKVAGIINVAGGWAGGNTQGSQSNCSLTVLQFFSQLNSL